jgi:hypothetical protein
MERTRLKGLRPKRIPNMKGLKEREKGSRIYKKDQKNQTCVKKIQRTSRTLGAWGEDQKHQTCMESV